MYGFVLHSVTCSVRDSHWSRVYGRGTWTRVFLTENPECYNYEMNMCLSRKKPQNDRDDGRTRLYLQMLLCTHNLLQLLFLHVSRWMVLETYIVFMLWHDFSILEAERCSHFTHYYFYVAYSVHEIILNVWSVRLIQKFPNRHPSASSGAKKIVGRSKNCWER
jgi:hypothetical protein